jgi:hypothetical protein
MPDAERFRILDVYTDDPARSEWKSGPPGWQGWVEANCKSRADVIRVLREALPMESSVALGVQFVDADGQTYSIEVRIGQWFRITRWVEVPAAGEGYMDPGPEAAFAPQPHLTRLLREWKGEEGS